MTAGTPGSDPGLQNERTTLAWRRTALSLLVATATMAKLTAEHWQVLALLWLLLGAPGAVGILVMSSRTYRRRRTDVLAVSPWPLIAWSTVITVGAGVLTVASVLA